MQLNSGKVHLTEGTWLRCQFLDTVQCEILSGVAHEEHYFLVISKETKHEPSCLLDVKTQKIWRHSVIGDWLSKNNSKMAYGLSAFSLTSLSKEQVTHVLGAGKVERACQIASDRKGG
jgi:hypothetical protein